MAKQERAVYNNWDSSTEFWEYRHNQAESQHRLYGDTVLDCWYNRLPGPDCDENALALLILPVSFRWKHRAQRFPPGVPLSR